MLGSPARMVPALQLATALGCAVLLGGCGGRALEANVYHGDGFAFRVGDIPADWQPIEVSDAALAFRDEGAGGTIVVNARCDRDGEDVPLASLTQHLFMRFTEREIVKEETVPFDGREALHTIVTAKLDGVPKSFSVWVLKKDGCVYDMIYIADPAGFQAGVAEFDAFAQALRVLPREGDRGS